uniref:Caspase family p20 domain-containing protein n=1 Tax=Salmo trutta TaxID=8032 RepID=A0A673XTL5_SALTR
MQTLRKKKTLLTEILCADSGYILQHDYKNLNIPNQSDEKKSRGVCVIINNALAEVFSRMKFRVVMCKDKTAVEIPIDLPKHGDAFVCCILSHGIKEGVCATDGTVVPTIDILSPFNGEKCTILVGKPKVFFIQAYRGVPVPKRNPVEDKELRADYDQVQNYTLPIWSDFLVVMAIRNKTKGSWFFQSLCGQLKDGHNSPLCLVCDN